VCSAPHEFLDVDAEKYSAATIRTGENEITAVMRCAIC
jgi:hypothetical protein